MCYAGMFALRWQQNPLVKQYMTIMSYSNQIKSILSTVLSTSEFYPCLGGTRPAPRYKGLDT